MFVKVLKKVWSKKKCMKKNPQKGFQTFMEIFGKLYFKFTFPVSNRFIFVLCLVTNLINLKKNNHGYFVSFVYLF